MVARVLLVGGGCLVLAAGAFAVSGSMARRVWGSARLARHSVLVAIDPSGPAGDRLYPGGTADVSVTVRNPNPYPIVITGVALPSSAQYAQGFSTPSLLVRRSGCGSVDSRVVWQYALVAHVTEHRLAHPLRIAPGADRRVILVDAASMSRSAPAMCEGAFFVMPSLQGVTAAAVRSADPPTLTTDAIEPVTAPSPVRRGVPIVPGRDRRPLRRCPAGDRGRP